MNGICKATRYGSQVLLVGLALWGATVAKSEEVLFFDDFSGDLSNWQELGNPGVPTVSDGQLMLEWGYDPNWFVTDQTFNFGSEPLRFDWLFTKGGVQTAANYQEVFIQPLLGATDPNTQNGGVMAQFSYQSFGMQRRILDANGNPAWQVMKFSKNTSRSNTLLPGSNVRIEIDATGKAGSFAIDGEVVNRFTYLGDDPLEGGFGFRDVVQRNIKVDNIKFSQIDANGAETVILSDDFNRADLGAEWVNETFAADSSPGPLNAYIENGVLFLENDGTGDTWLRTAKQAAFAGKTTVFEFTFVDYLSGSTYNPSVVVGTKPYVATETSGVLLFDNGPGFNYGMEGGGWTGGRAQAANGIFDGMTFRVEVDKGAQSGKTYRNGVEVARWKSLGPILHGSFAFRSIVNRDAAVDDLRIYTVDDNGTQTTVFEDNFNRDDLGPNWVVEAITPGGLVDALLAYPADDDQNGENELYLDHDETTEDNWVRLTKDLPYGDKMLVIEGVYEYMNPDDRAPSVVVGTTPWQENTTIGPILLDYMQSAWGMDTRGGNVWVNLGPIAGTKISLVVNADGKSGSMLTNDVLITEWALAPEEAPIPAGAFGFRDPFTAPRDNVAPGSGKAGAWYDDVRVTKLDSTAATDWMLHE